LYQNPDREFPYYSSPAVNERIVVIGGRDKEVHGLDARTGRQIWSFRTGSRVDSSPVILGDRVFVGSSDGNLYALDTSSGKEAWRFETGAGIFASPAIADDRLVISSDEGVVYCFGEPPVPDESRRPQPTP
jgi:outer membrane protein assembly factor BamB